MANIVENIYEFLDPKKIQNDPTGRQLGRYQSWDIVYEDFSKSKDVDFLARSLAIYLASWGMMRGSSKLLSEYNYRIHIEAVNTLLPHLDPLRSYPSHRNEIAAYVATTCGVIADLKEYYGKLGVSHTDTLMTKILLGTTAATPAYDRFFKEFLKNQKLTQTLGIKSLTQVWNLYFDNKDELSEFDYPAMKLLDMAGFQYGKLGESKIQI